jgi:predicted amidohydrolase YtcJ
VPISGLRWVVAHVPFITADYVARLKALGGGVNLTPYEYFGTSSPAGPPYRMIADSGIPYGLSSDDMQIAPLNPWIHAYYATTVLSDDYFTVPDSALWSLHSVLTVVGGTVVHSGPIRYWA